MTTDYTLTSPSEVLVDVKCPTPCCDGEVKALPGVSAGYFTGVREYYSTWHVFCSKCRRQGIPGYYQGAENSAAGLKEATRLFLERDSTPKLGVIDA